MKKHAEGITNMQRVQNAEYATNMQRICKNKLKIPLNM